MPEAPDVRSDQITIPLPHDYIAPRVDEPETARSLVLALLRDVGLAKR